MNILFLTLLDISDKNENPIYLDLVRYFQKKGHNIFAVCPVERRNKANTSLSNNDNINILKVKIGNIRNANFVEKGFSTLLIERQYINAVNKYFSNVKFDLVLYTTPPITFENVVRFIKKRDKARTYLLLKDIFPQNAVDLGMFSKSSLFYKYFRNKEKKLYNQSDNIGCMSQANVDFIVKYNSVNPNKVEICPNSIEPVSVCMDIKTKEKIRKKYDIPLNKTIFVYGGNIGKPQGIDFLMECLKSNKNNRDSFFLIVGSGTEFNKLKVFIENEKIPNTSLFSRLPKEDYESLVNSSDVGLIFLDKRFTIPNFPSRILSYMQASMPILAATDTSTDLGEILESGGFGNWCKSGDVESFNKLIKVLSTDNHLRSNMGRNAREYLEDHYTVEKSYRKIMNHFEREIINV